MHRLVTACRPTSALGQTIDRARMNGSANDNVSALDFLEMTFEAEIRIAHGQHLGVDRTVCAVTGSAAFVHSFVFEHIRTTLIGMALETSSIL
jgi:hypothetical protein